jgi:hypothetical protein
MTCIPCTKASDCKTGCCSNYDVCVPLSSQCMDTQPCENGCKDANEADVDCGGSCTKKKCGEGSMCIVNEDCVLGLSCQNETCQTAMP